MKNKFGLEDLQIFCAAARRSNFALAAQDLSVSAAQISKRISQLEQQLGAKLFHRTTRRVAITDVGEQLYQRALKLIEEAKEIEDIADVSRSAPQGRLRLSANFRLGRNHVAPIVSLMASEYPKLEVWLELFDRSVDIVREAFDIDVRIGKVPEPYLIGHRLAQNSRVLCAAPEYLRRYGKPKSVADLARHRCLALRERDQVFGVWRLEGPDEQVAVKVTGPMASNDSDVVMRWGLSGQGILLSTEYYITKAIARGDLEIILPQYRQPADVWAVTTSRLANSPKVRVCVEFLKKHFESGPFALGTHDAVSEIADL